MSETVIKVENLSKQYRLGDIGTGSITHDLNRWWYAIRGKENPYLKIGEENDRSIKGGSGYVWALQNLNFEIKQGEAVGIVGRNGAGKSTLLKILSRTTNPSKGKVKLKGKIASLLEVGTGFHPDLSGRENIFLNGAILGMSKQEIKSKFDEIVDFAGIERYIDTPVKRFSSGMYVRLAFGVAAHLEPDILIVDEVLAVGDAEFQKKALGKMQDVSRGQGRTVLFVSHNMSAVSSLTSKSILLQNGKLISYKSTNEIIGEYLSLTKAKAGTYLKTPHKHKPSIVKVEIVTSEPALVQASGKRLEILIDVNMPEYMEGMGISIQICTENEVAAVHSYLFDVDRPILRKTGINKLRCVFDYCRLYQGEYYLRINLAESKGRTIFESLDKICAFEVQILDKIIEWGWQPNTCIYMEDFAWEI
jgi:lipopolysaccharide transport system ATP-binding protein